MATIKDIAEAVGVSIGTVDRILHERGRYSEKTAEKVRNAMKELNYTPNIHARGLKQTKKYTFAALIPRQDQDGGYWELVQEGIERAAQTLESYGSRVCIFSFDRYSQKSFRDAFCRAVNSEAEGLLIAPVRPDDTRNMLGTVSLPYLFIDSDIPGMTGQIAYIGQDSLQSGILSGRLMNLLLSSRTLSSDQPDVLVVDPPGSNSHLKSRMEGFRQSLKAAWPQAELFQIKEESDNEEDFHRYLGEYFENFSPEKAWKPDGIFVANSSVYYVASFLEKRGAEYTDIPLIGYDLLPGREGMITNGVIDFILTQQPEEQGYRGIIMLYDNLILKQDVAEEVITPLNIITRENLPTFMNYRRY